MPCYKKTVHCSICGTVFHGSFAERMRKLRHHRKHKHHKAPKQGRRKHQSSEGWFF